MGSKSHSSETSSTLPRRHQAYSAEETYELDDMDAFEEDYANEYGMDKLLRRLRMAITRTMKTLVISTVPWRKPMLPTLTLDVNLQTFVQLVDTILWLLWRRMHHQAVLDNNTQFLLVMAKAR
jgi:hypothetical protein